MTLYHRIVAQHSGIAYHAGWFPGESPAAAIQSARNGRSHLPAHASLRVVETLTADELADVHRRVIPLQQPSVPLDRVRRAREVAR